MIASWAVLAFRWRNTPDVILMGTDPILSVVIAPLWRLLHPRVKIVHWCFDLYPEAAYADSLLSSNGSLAHLLKWLMKHSYRACDLIVDLGPCMRDLLSKYSSGVTRNTLTPWALSEPSSALLTTREARRAIFGQADLALMYSGTMGRAHSFEDLLELMKALRDSSAHLALSVQGNREQELRSAISPEDSNICFVPFASTAALEERLASADIHVVSLRPEWTGLVIPSKFFGALAVGRPVLFCGSADSGIAKWIEEYDVGWVLTPGNALEVADRLKRFAEDESSMKLLRNRCHHVYRLHFSRDAIITRWDSDLQNLLSSKSAA
jgi:colanic acid biosynthesis glycosyl transferase WcaI